jgi:hypothetical protein
VTFGLPDVELLDVSTPDGEATSERVDAGRSPWLLIVGAFALVAAIVLSGRAGTTNEADGPGVSGARRSPADPATTVPHPRSARGASEWPNAAFSIVMTDKVSGRIVVVDPRGRALRLPTRSEGLVNPLEVAVPEATDSALGGLPTGRRPVAVLDRSIVLVPSSTAGPPVEVWGGGANLEVVDDAGRFVAASENRIATVDGECTDCALRISSSEGQLVQVIESFAGFQPVSRGWFSPNGRWIVIRYAQEHRPYDGVAIADLQRGTVFPLRAVSGEDALAMAWSSDSNLYLLGARGVTEYDPQVGPTRKIAVENWTEPR